MSTRLTIQNGAILSGSLDISGSGRFTDGLTVTGSITASGDLTTQGQHGVYAIGNNPGVWFNTTRTVGMGGTSSPDSIVFRTNNIDNRLVIDSGGRIGIGNLSPSHSLDVLGSARITDVLILPYQDPLPASPATGSIALSGSGVTFVGMFVWTGTWTQI